jgi:hypothetical protein
MFNKFCVVMAVPPAFGSSSAVLAASQSGKAGHYKYNHAITRVAPQNSPRLDPADPECGFAGIQEHGPNGHQPC